MVRLYTLPSTQAEAKVHRERGRERERERQSKEEGMKRKASSKKSDFKAKRQQVSRLNTGAETEEHFKTRKRKG